MITEDQDSPWLQLISLRLFGLARHTSGLQKRLPPVARYMLLRGTALQETLSIRDNLQPTSNDQDRPNETFLARLLNKKDFRESIQLPIHLLIFNGPKYIKRITISTFDLTVNN